MVLYHLAEADVWTAGVRNGEYTGSTKGRSLADVGFIHCSFEDQVARVASMLFAEGERPILVTIDEAKLAAPVRVEAADEGGEEFPHIYGPLNLDAVVSASPYEG